MKNLIYYGLLLIFLSPPVLCAQGEKSFTILTEQWPPFNYIEDSKLTGLSTEVVQLIMKDLGIKAEITVLPSMRARAVLDESKRALFFSFIRTAEREKNYKWIGPIAKDSIYFYKQKNSELKIKTLEDAKKVNSVCSRNAGLVFKLLNQAGFKNLDTSVTAESIYLKTILGRCDLAISETPAGYLFWMKEMKRSPDTLTQTPVSIINSSLYIAASLDIPDQEIAQWQNTLDKIKATKAYQCIVEKYK